CARSDYSLFDYW
nr:immunoglobulin heavy chain junction region [Macaca mulatta]